MVPEDDDVDAVVDGWTNRLTVEDQPVFFEDLLREDLEMRTVVVEDEEEEEEEAEEEAPVDQTSDGPSGGVLGQREFQEVLLAELNALNQKVDESRDIMVAGFKEIKEEMRSLNERVTGVENFVSEFRMDGDLPSVINLSHGKGRYDLPPEDPLGDSINILATAASKVTEKRVEEEEGQVGKGGEVEKDVSGEHVIVEEGEQIVEKDKREKKKEKGKKQGKAQEQELQDVVDEEQAKAVEEGGGGKKQKKRKTHSALTKPPYGRPNTRQKTTTEGATD